MATSGCVWTTFWTAGAGAATRCDDEPAVQAPRPMSATSPNSVIFFMTPPLDERCRIVPGRPEGAICTFEQTPRGAEKCTFGHERGPGFPGPRPTFFPVQVSARC